MHIIRITLQAILIASLATNFSALPAHDVSVTEQKESTSKDASSSQSISLLDRVYPAAKKLCVISFLIVNTINIKNYVNNLICRVVKR